VSAHPESGDQTDRVSPTFKKSLVVNKNFKTMWAPPESQPWLLVGACERKYTWRYPSFPPSLGGGIAISEGTFDAPVARRSIEGDAQHSGGHTTRDGGKKIQTAKGGAARRGRSRTGGRGAGGWGWPKRLLGGSVAPDPGSTPLPPFSDGPRLPALWPGDRGPGADRDCLPTPRQLAGG